MLSAKENNCRRSALPILLVIPPRNLSALFEGESLLPLGGARETGGHKGYCMASIVDLLCGVFTGASWGPFVPSFRNHPATREEQVGRGIGHLFGSIWTGAFEDSLVVRHRADSWVRTMRETRPANWSGQVLVPGDPERAAAADSLENGVSLEKSGQDDLRQLAEEIGLPFCESR